MWSTLEADIPAGMDGVPTVVKMDNPISKGSRIELSVPRLHLVVEKEGGKAASRPVFIDGDLCRIGSHASSDLVLEDPTISRFHCRLVRTVDGWRLEDTGSKNGTRIDGMRVRDADLPKTCTLALGDSLVRVKVGDTSSGMSVPAEPTFGGLAGQAQSMRKLYALIERVAQGEIDVLIEGESGTGKELVATEIKQRGMRANKPFIVVDCGAISQNLVESELFGHVRGAFTGAERDRVGAFEAADGGTVFLDEIGELPLELQPKLLRALEAREVRRVGETKARRVDVRVIAATHRDLEREVNQGRFREDLYFRLAKVTLRVPPLRERLDDLPLLVKRFAQATNNPDAENIFSPQDFTEMERHDWPGNVRELRNFVERSVVLRNVEHATKRKDTPPPPSQRTDENEAILPFRQAKEVAVDTFERAYIGRLLERCEGNLSKAARTAGMDRMYLYHLAQKHGLRGGGAGTPKP
jgi:DNA-binding NtrC family response regulator